MIVKHYLYPHDSCLIPTKNRKATSGFLSETTLLLLQIGKATVLFSRFTEVKQPTKIASLLQKKYVKVYYISVFHVTSISSCYTKGHPA